MVIITVDDPGGEGSNSGNYCLILATVGVNGKETRKTCWRLKGWMKIVV